MKKILILLTIIIVALFAVTTVANADTYKQLEKKNTKYLMCRNDKEVGSSTIEFWVTYYSPELWKLHKEKTKTVTTDTASSFLTTLRDDETVAFKIKINNNAPPIELNPINTMITLRIDGKKYKSTENDLNLSYSFQGENEGFIYFPRFDKKTGKDIFKNAKRMWLDFDTVISPVMQGSSPSLRWDL